LGKKNSHSKDLQEQQATEISGNHDHSTKQSYSKYRRL
jgi:hypothetical protein